MLGCSSRLVANDIRDSLDRAVSQWKKPLLFVLLLLGVVGIAAAGVGLAGYGANQFGWSLDFMNQFHLSGLNHFMTNLGALNSMIMMAVGGGGGMLFVAAAVAILVNSHSSDLPVQNPEKSDLEKKYEPLLECGQFTFTRQSDGKYSVIARNEGLGVHTHEENIDESDLVAKSVQISYTFVETEEIPESFRTTKYYLPVNSKAIKDIDKIASQLKRGQVTCVVDDAESNMFFLIWRKQPQQHMDVIFSCKLTFEKIPSHMPKNFTLVKTDQWPMGYAIKNGSIIKADA